MDIRITDIEKFRNFLYKNREIKLKSVKLSFNTQLRQVCDNSLVINLKKIGESKYRDPDDALKNILSQKNLKGFLPNLLALFLLDYREEIVLNRFNYEPEDLHNVFNCLDRNKLKERKGLLEQYNALIVFLLGEHHPFGNIYLNENWEIVGGNIKIEKLEKDDGGKPRSRNTFSLNFKVASIIGIIASVIVISNKFLDSCNSNNTSVNNEMGQAMFFDNFGDTSCFSRNLCILSKQGDWDSINKLIINYQNDTFDRNLILYYKGLSLIEDSNNIETGKDPSFYFYQIEIESDYLISGLRKLTFFYMNMYKKSREEYDIRANDLIQFLKYKGLFESPIYFYVKFYLNIGRVNLDENSYEFHDFINDVAKDDNIMIEKINAITKKLSNNMNGLSIDSSAYYEYLYIQYLYKSNYSLYPENYFLSKKDSIKYKNYLNYFKQKTPYKVVEKGALSFGFEGPEDFW